MIDDEDDPQFKAVVRALFEQAATLANMRGWSAAMLEEMQGLCDSAVVKAKAHGVVLPDMVVVALERQRIVKIHRRDATEDMIQTYLRNVIEEMVAARIAFEPKELAEAFGKAYPKHPGAEYPGLTRRQRRTLLARQRGGNGKGGQE